MTFVSLTFIVFFALVLVGTRLPLAWRAKKAFLLGASYIFYAAWSPPFVLLLLGSTFVDWVLAKKIHAATDAGKKKAFVTLSLVVNLGVLAGFKYAGLFVGSVAWLIGKDGDAGWVLPNIILPVGISFYTFQTLSYSIDVYRGRLTPATDVVDYALYVSFFPQLVAGPIVRAETFLPQCVVPRRATAEEVAWGLALFIFGLFMKMVLADTFFAPAAEALFTATGPVHVVDAWGGTLAFAGQILCDFSGYSLCAIGIAAALGFQLPDNFFRPYAAVGFSDFWRRWHISLSTWLRDYLYIPLGGSRHGLAKTAFALTLTMWLGGLWHGAAWTFLAWGALHGAYLSLERVGRSRLKEAAWVHRPEVHAAYGIVTFVLVVIAWVPFRAPNFSRVWEIWKGMVHAGGATVSAIPTATLWLAMAALALLLLAQVATRKTTFPDLVAKVPTPFRALLLALFLLSILLAPADDRAFIYFQF